MKKVRYCKKLALRDRLKLISIILRGKPFASIFDIEHYKDGSPLFSYCVSCYNVSDTLKMIRKMCNDEIKYFK